jgi:hypothetical protein
MPKSVLMDEFWVKVFVPDRLAPAESRSIRRVLSSHRFRLSLTKTLRNLFARYPSLAKTRIKVAA